uniref:Kinase, NEK n=1 Tax=Trepomonas sp. PC1 TaxID=1076344 RepID=A0A146KGG4_9EUKA|eukprot:JAP94349.1 Kinase, NEK [Trepomonas sp. PC1]
MQIKKEQMGIKMKMLRKIGQGAERPVMLMEDDNKRKCVLKANTTKIYSDDIERVYALSHKNIVEILAYSTEQDKQFCIMEYMNGGDLTHYLDERSKSNRPLEFEEIITIFEQICRGLLYLHSKGIVHGDLTPNNILLEFDNKQLVSVKLADYLQNNTSNPMYMSPELVQLQIKNELFKPTIESDLWSLGVILYQMVKGKLPFLSVNEILNSQIPKLHLVQFCFQKIIKNSLQKQPQNRMTLINIIRHVERKIIAKNTSLSSICISSMQNTNFNEEEFDLLDFSDDQNVRTFVKQIQ